jgi:hypothetical protein
MEQRSFFQSRKRRLAWLESMGGCSSMTIPAVRCAYFSFA